MCFIHMHNCFTVVYLLAAQNDYYYITVLRYYSLQPHCEVIVIITVRMVWQVILVITRSIGLPLNAVCHLRQPVSQLVQLSST